ncbi:MAG TPA: protoporphyrinogen oxidase [Candidatus Acidoferrum sp.]|nr:protoporphyrinogen oxidase [Candidatus Acidoferrum sp.]
MSTHVQALVVGAGISGLVCAYSLRKAGLEVLLAESSSRPGGLIRSETRDGYLLELGPQSFSSTPQILALCRELEIADQLVSAPPRAPRYLLLRGKLQSAPLSPPAFFTTSLFGARTKWSVVRDLFGRSSPPVADESVADFIRRKFSAELLEKLVGPFISGIYAGDPEKLSLRAAFPQLCEAEKNSGSIIRGMLRAAKQSKAQSEAMPAAGSTSTSPEKKRPSLQSFRDGNETLVRALAKNLGSALRTEAQVTGIRRTSSASEPLYEVTLSANGAKEIFTTDNLVLATPTQVSANLLGNISPATASSLSSIEYAPIAVVSLGYIKSSVGHSLDGFGFLIPRSEKLRTLGTVWNSSLFPGRAPEGHALLTSFIGGATDPEAPALPPAELSSRIHKEIAPFLRISQPPVFANVQAYSRALPQYNLGHSALLASLGRLRSDLRGVWLAGNYLRGPAIGACIEQALSIAAEISSRPQQSALRGAANS